LRIPGRRTCPPRPPARRSLFPPDPAAATPSRPPASKYRSPARHPPATRSFPRFPPADACRDKPSPAAAILRLHFPPRGRSLPRRYPACSTPAHSAPARRPTRSRTSPVPRARARPACAPERHPAKRATPAPPPPPPALRPGEAPAPPHRCDRQNNATARPAPARLRCDPGTNPPCGALPLFPPRQAPPAPRLEQAQVFLWEFRQHVVNFSRRHRLTQHLDHHPRMKNCRRQIGRFAFADAMEKIIQRQSFHLCLRIALKIDPDFPRQLRRQIVGLTRQKPLRQRLQRATNRVHRLAARCQLRPMLHLPDKMIVLHKPKLLPISLAQPRPGTKWVTPDLSPLPCPPTAPHQGPSAIPPPPNARPARRKSGHALRE